MSGLIDGDLTQHDQQRVTRHIAGCKRCARVLAGLRATVCSVRLLVDEPSVPTRSVAEHVLRRIADEGVSRR
jgi:anti-sigma factor RsiW